MRASPRHYNGSGGFSGGTNRKTLQILVLIIGILAVICIILAILLFAGSTPDTRVRDVLIDQARSQFSSAQESASQLSRVGGSTTMRMLAKTRQHLYAISQVNTFSETLLVGNNALIPSEPIDAAIISLESCEARILEGRDIDEPLSALWENLYTIMDYVEALA